ncbi:MAG: LPS assembly lipoprotein LptE [Planctomycetota bacterium]|nr:LPS assembly lipoprotein LptE [Planctomycetota bacterium]
MRVILILFCVACTSCKADPTIGYSSSSLYPKQYQSIAIPIFQNTTMTRDIEFMLTDAIVKEIQTRSPYRVVDKHAAQTLLSGTVTATSLRTLSRSQTTGLDNEVLFKVVVDFEWLDQISGKRIAGRKNFASSAVFMPSRPSSEPLEIGQFAVVQQLASDIVDQMQASW